MFVCACRFMRNRGGNESLGVSEEAVEGRKKDVPANDGGVAGLRVKRKEQTILNYYRSTTKSVLISEQFGIIIFLIFIQYSWQDDGYKDVSAIINHLQQLCILEDSLFRF